VVDGDGIAAGGLPVTFRPAGVQIRYGRLAIQNTHGSELQNLAMPLTVQHFAGAAVGFVSNGADVCTNGLLLGLSDLDPGDALETTAAGSETCVYAAAAVAGNYACGAVSAPLQFTEPPTGGSFNLNLGAPGADAGGVPNTGVVGVTADAPAWLEFDWFGGGMTDPSGRATFGVYHQDSALIYLREMR
jgi:MSHA biogenesis protein MshQ